MSGKKIEFTIPLPPITKKNSQRIITVNGRPMIIPSAKYKEYEKECGWFMPSIDVIDCAINLKCLFYMPTRRRVDLNNLEEAITDILVKYQVLEDDNSNIVYSMDGSRVLYDKENPRTEVEIEKISVDKV